MAVDTQNVDVVKLLNAVLMEGVKTGASDIHIERLEDKIQVRYRIDGFLQSLFEMPRNVQQQVVARAKVMSDLDFSEKRLPQDGRAQIAMGDRTVELRVSVLPSHLGEKVVFRMIDSAHVILDLDKLGFLPDDFEKFRELVGAPQGTVIITGPTGSGKSSTLYGALNHLNEVHRSIVTVEDPVECVLRGVNQVQIHERAGLTFAAALRAILRQDPDVVMVGEVRDVETAEIAFRAAQTGHMVLTTLHANSTAATITRLRHMGVAPYLLTASLRGVVAQRLVRRVCTHCPETRPPDPRAAKFITMATGREAPAEVTVGKGCDYCRGTGYKGRIGLYEVLTVSERLKELIFHEASAPELALAAREGGMRSLGEDGLAKVQMGITTLEEVQRVVTVEPSGVKTCKQCHREMEDEFKVCPWCSQGARSTCRSCGKVVQEDWQTCPHCTFSLIY